MTIRAHRLRFRLRLRRLGLFLVRHLTGRTGRTATMPIREVREPLRRERRRSFRIPARRIPERRRVWRIVTEPIRQRRRLSRIDEAQISPGRHLSRIVTEPIRPRRHLSRIDEARPLSPLTRRGWSRTRECPGLPGTSCPIRTLPWLGIQTSQVVVPARPEAAGPTDLARCHRPRARPSKGREGSAQPVPPSRSPFEARACLPCSIHAPWARAPQGERIGDQDT